METKKLFLIISLIGVVFLAKPVFADTIVLKDGKTIKCDTARQEGNIVRYWIGEAVLTISNDKVERIERDNQRGEALTSSPSSTLPEKPSNSSTSNKLNLKPSNKIIVRSINNNATVENAEKLEASLKNNPQDKAKIKELVEILNILAFTESEANQVNKAKEFLNRALELDTENVDSLLALASIEIREGNYSNAVQHAEKAVNSNPSNQLAHYYVGVAYYNLEDLTKAVAAWKMALKLGDNLVIKAALEKAEKELALTSDFSNGRNRFFNVVLEGGSANLGLESQLLIALEDSYGNLKRQFNYEPKERISAIFYAKQTFSDITRAPSWAGALNDGKLRIPVGGLTSVNSELTKTITHELTHSFVHFKSRGKCPTWLNEGIAQLMEGESANQKYKVLAKVLVNSPSFNLKVLSGSFIRFSPEEANLAYAYSLAATELLCEKGINVAISILEDLSQNSTIDAAISKNTRFKDLQTFEKELIQRISQ